MIRISKIFEKTKLESYSEFYFMLAIIRECYRRGIKADISDIEMEKDITPEEHMNYLRYLISLGAVEGMSVDKEIPKSKFFFDTKSFEELGPNKLFEVKNDKYVWSYEYATKAYVDYLSTLLYMPMLGNILIHIVAYFTVSSYLGELDKKYLQIDIEDRFSLNNTYIYVNLLSCSKTLKCFENIFLNIDLESYNLDLDYVIFYNNGVAANRIKYWSNEEKVKLMSKENFVEGGIYLLWERHKMNNSNPAGRILNSTVIALNEIHDTYIEYTTIGIGKTQEEIIDDYYEIPEDKRSYFADILNFSVSQTKKTIRWMDLGVSNYMCSSESFFIDKIDKHAKVLKKITINGQADYINLSEIDAIYWLLCQYNVEFDRDLYKDIYSPNKDLLWDLYN